MDNEDEIPGAPALRPVPKPRFRNVVRTAKNGGWMLSGGVVVVIASAFLGKDVTNYVATTISLIMVVIGVDLMIAMKKDMKGFNKEMALSRAESDEAHRRFNEKMQHLLDLRIERERRGDEWRDG